MEIFVTGLCYEFGLEIDKNEDNAFKFYKISSD